MAAGADLLAGLGGTGGGGGWDDVTFRDCRSLTAKSWISSSSLDSSSFSMMDQRDSFTSCAVGALNNVPYTLILPDKTLSCFWTYTRKRNLELWHRYYSSVTGHIQQTEHRVPPYARAGGVHYKAEHAFLPTFPMAHYGQHRECGTCGLTAGRRG